MCREGWSLKTGFILHPMPQCSQDPHCSISCLLKAETCTWVKIQALPHLISLSDISFQVSKTLLTAPVKGNLKSMKHKCAVSIFCMFKETGSWGTRQSFQLSLVGLCVGLDDTNRLVSRGCQLPHSLYLSVATINKAL